MPSKNSAKKPQAVAARPERYFVKDARPAAMRHMIARTGNEGEVSRENQKIAPQPIKTGTKRKSWPNARSSAKHAAIF
ncbi:hypothetical protein GGE28_001074 [Agrobacterium tumefaciens]|nr:hypothetical protein [Agrobacterium radiobacter]MBB4322648.1 hypothetical protein [Agrobacterium radiobacter]